jgi:hypothetical protein
MKLLAEDDDRDKISAMLDGLRRTDPLPITDAVRRQAALPPYRRTAGPTSQQRTLATT